MTLLAAQAGFLSELTTLWDNPTDDLTIYDTADIIEDFWSNAVITGYPPPPSTTEPTSQSTYPAFSGLTLPSSTITAPTVAGIFETALSAMVLATLFVPLAPAVVTDVAIPTLPATLPGALTTALTAIFSVQSEASVAETIGNLISLYLQGWTIPVAVPPAAAAPLPII